MVSFSCENCGDVLTKKKLDTHYNRCYGQFTCIDCMTTFNGTSYRSHTSCISEDQKYQGALYKEKAPKNKKSVNIVEPRQSNSKQPYIEDVPDQDDKPSTSNGTGAVTAAPPTAPSPPPSAGIVAKIPVKPNVFDFLVDDETPNASRVNLAEPMQMVAHAPPVFRSHSHSPPSSSGRDNERRTITHEDSVASNGYAYGAGPVPASNTIDLYRTPAPKESRRRQESPSRYAPEVVQSVVVKKSTDKKRKRHFEELDLSQAQQYHDVAAMEVDDPNFVPAQLQHSGLTGGLSRMLSKSGRAEYPPSPAYSQSGVDDKYDDSDYSDVDETPLNPAKTRRDRERKSKEGGKDKDREDRRGRPSAASSAPGAATSGALVKVRPNRRTSDESRPRKHHRSHRHRSDEHPDRERNRRASGESEARRRKPKAIEWKNQSDDDYEDVEDGGVNGQMVLYKDGERRASSSGRSKAEWFLSFVTKGPDSEKGYSINKALKRYHRERVGEGGSGNRREDRDRERIEDEKDLWKSLRLRRNERGEVVVFILEGED